MTTTNTNTNAIVKAVKAPEIEKLASAIVAQERTYLKEKVQYVKGIKYNPKKVKFAWSKEMMEMLSKAYAYKGHIYDVDSKYRNNIAFLTQEIENIMDKEEKSDEDFARLNELDKERRKSQACLSAFKRGERENVQYIVDDINSRLYEAYCMRQVDENAWIKALSDYFKSFDMACDNSLVKFISDNVGSRVASVKNWHAFMVDNMTVNGFGDLVLSLLLQLAIDKSAFSAKIIESELKGVAKVAIEEFDSFKTVERPNAKTTKAWYKAVLEEVGGEMPKANDKIDAYRKAYNKAKKARLFVEY